MASSDKQNHTNNIWDSFQKGIQKGKSYLTSQKPNPHTQPQNTVNNTDKQEINMWNNDDLDCSRISQAGPASGRHPRHDREHTPQTSETTRQMPYNFDADKSNHTDVTRPAATEEAAPHTEPIQHHANRLDPTLEAFFQQSNTPTAPQANTSNNHSDGADETPHDADTAPSTQFDGMTADVTEPVKDTPAEPVPETTTPADPVSKIDNSAEPEQPKTDPLVDAQRTAQDILKDARKQADRIIAEAQQKAAKIKADADLVTANAQSQADQIREKAKAELRSALYEKQETIAAANRQYNFIVKNAEAEKRTILERCADEEVRQLVAAKLHDYFVDGSAEEVQLRKNLNDEYSRMAQDHSALIERVDHGAQAVQTSIATSMEEALRSIRDAQNQMQQELDNWRREQYKVNYRDLTVCFTNLDKLIAGMEKRLEKELAYGDESYHGEFAKELKRYVQNMKVLRSTFESSLAKLGIKAYYPAPGTPFNSFIHTLADLDPENEDDASFNDKPITSCVKAGLMRVTQHGEDCLLSAFVTVDRNT